MSEAQVQHERAPRQRRGQTASAPALPAGTTAYCMGLFHVLT